MKSEDAKLLNEDETIRVSFDDAMTESKRPTASTHSFSIENLGPIRKAEIELHPLTLFVGENNSGKSWTAAALWAMHQDAFRYFSAPGTAEWDEGLHELQSLMSAAAVPHDSAEQHAINRWLSSRTGEAPPAIQELSMHWSARMQALRGKALRTLFGAIGIPNQSVPLIRCHPRSGRMFLSRTEPLNNVNSPLQSLPAITSITSEPMSAEGSRFMCSVPEYLTQNAPHFLANVLFSWFAGWPIIWGASGYFPASRSAFLQLLPMLAQSQFLRGAPGSSPNETNDLELTAQQKWFAALCVGPVSKNPDKGFAPDLATIIESEILRGKVQAQPNAPGQFSFVPEGHPTAIPASSTSSVVTELIPLVHMFRCRAQVGFLVIEEPEAHLHPRLQRKLARVLVRLVNRGVRVLLTTHSDFIAQQVNNCIKLGTLRQRMNPVEFSALLQTLGLVDEECLSVPQVAGYEFVRADSGETTVNRLKTTNEGVVMPTFNEDLIALGKEIDLLQDALDRHPAVDT